MNSLQLSNRLRIVASYLPDHAMFADIGSDHAYLPCYVCLQDHTATAIAGEVNEGPFQSAKSEVSKQGLKDRIEVRKGNGLEVIDSGEVSEITIAGMGASLISLILNDGLSKLKHVSRLILQPNVNAILLRKWFIDHGYELIDEQIVEEEGHYYEILVADKGMPRDPYTDENFEKELLFGPFLMRKSSETFRQKWTSEAENIERILSEMRKASQPNHDKIEDFTRKLNWIKEVLQSES
ncbi:tRNA (adenine(22)-N(1))-methyltransferase TrmK [Pontibacillus yanchengensis]|uniref:tRNA (Adenine(22)-N(1))-methyltransferase TrmK n=2 Tax=Pontibacillus yanchengensis TaxID=462910 RepID=A0ACC7VH37_9BACI|nr:tRNA (adenine(22)-N(1))-methyltransferase TrmK [Pontibacillus yanchengensis]MYL33444.1 tRNA (adenine(22)-N(1))-methyltransferase TrmK [Pontibacillus yanchengensis]MYL53494.1 tRNA (adenine(22)-N(1))-methyltransferase TrmK [Pontibacillus yanchengensis]